MRLDGGTEAGRMRGRETWKVSKVWETEAHSCTSWSQASQSSRFLSQVVGAVGTHSVGTHGLWSQVRVGTSLCYLSTIMIQVVQAL